MAEAPCRSDPEGNAVPRGSACVQVWPHDPSWDFKGLLTKPRSWSGEPGGTGVQRWSPVGLTPSKHPGSVG